VALDIKDVPWAQRQMWAPDVACKNDKYYFYFPARAQDGNFKIGVAVGECPEGPFTALPEPIQGSYSIDPAVFEDDDGEYYMFFGGLWGGQLQHYPGNEPRVAKLDGSMLEFSESVSEIEITDENGNPLLAGDNERRYFEGPWVHKYQKTYYLSYSTGDTHFICYATASTPYGPYTYRGQILTPVIGWTTHHSIVTFEGRWYLFYHDASLSGGVTHLRSMKAAELFYNEDGSIKPLSPYKGY